MSLSESTSAVIFLRNLLAERGAQDKSYSLRTFAASLGLSASYLSQVLSGKRKLLADTALRVSPRLGLGNDQAELFCLLAQHDAHDDGAAKDALAGRIRAARRRLAPSATDADQLRVIKDWYHLAILEMTTLGDFPLTPEAAAARLGIDADKAGAAIERLVRLGLLVQEGGSYRKRAEDFVFRMPDRHDAFQAFHEQMLELSGRALRRDEMSSQLFTSQTFSIDKAKLPAAKLLVREFLEKMAAFFDDEKPKTDTYHLSVQLFNLTSGARE